MLRAALALGIGPEAFWRLSLREWRWLARGGEAPSRGELMAMMADHPDTGDRNERV
ncbi:MAG: phage tail assembly chaperone [Hyphomonas sp.]|nr:phage tail assembly chaperone [Hyphomonas sp.]